MSAAMVGALSWPTIAFIVLVFQSLIIWRLRVQVRQLAEYEYWYYSQSVQPQQLPQSQPLVQTRLPRRPLPRR
jgi:hypothetical protein